MPREDRLRKWYWTMLETAKAEVGSCVGDGWVGILGWVCPTVAADLRSLPFTINPLLTPSHG